MITAIDFETANYSDASICAVGIATFEETGELLESFHSLVRPPKGHGWFREEFIECHGIHPWDVWDEPEFPSLAEELTGRIRRSSLVIAHNAAFDMRKLKGTLAHFGLPCPEFNYLCTLHAARKIWPGLQGYGLGSLAARIGHIFCHHNAQDDAEAAGRLLYALMQSSESPNLNSMIESIGLTVLRCTQAN